MAGLLVGATVTFARGSETLSGKVVQQDGERLKVALDDGREVWVNSAAVRSEAPDAEHGARRSELARIAKYQRLINVAVLLNVAGLVGGVMLGALSGTFGSIVIGLVYIGAVVVSLYGTMGLASSLFNSLVAVLCFFLLLVPCVNLLVLLLLNSRATRQLQEAGIKVGLLGADPRQFAG
ncbi:MAG TPA: hypothetical protein VM686_21125 [Polyangiaceae bacterium]|jgi:hypothetical protein|nr:hypothetical protein [Polyangiaceae bacterium]